MERSPKRFANFLFRFSFNLPLLGVFQPETALKIGKSHDLENFQIVSPISCRRQKPCFRAF